MPHVDVNSAKQLAQSIIDTPQDQVADMVHALRKSQRLSSTTQALNQLLLDEHNRELARRALRRLGFACE